ncbi:MAG: MliC family protein [Burkholderiales bacterium]
MRCYDVSVCESGHPRDPQGEATPLRAGACRLGATAQHRRGAELDRPWGGRWIGAVAFAALLSAGCGTSTQGGYPAEYPADGKSAGPGEVRMLYACRDGEQIEVRFLDARGGIALVSRRGRTVQLKQQSDASGNIYSDGRTTMRSKGRDLRLEMQGLEPIECRSQGSD